MIKKIYLFSATWCGPCKVFHKAFEQAKTMEEFKDIDFVDCDIEDDEAVDMVEDFVVKSVPTVIMTDGENNVLGRFSGNITLQEFVDKIKDADSGNGSIS